MFFGKNIEHITLVSVAKTWFWENVRHKLSWWWPNSNNICFFYNLCWVYSNEEGTASSHKVFFPPVPFSLSSSSFGRWCIWVHGARAGHPAAYRLGLFFFRPWTLACHSCTEGQSPSATNTGTPCWPGSSAPRGSTRWTWAAPSSCTRLGENAGHGDLKPVFILTAIFIWF